MKYCHFTYKKEFIFKNERPFKSCHASTLLELENDTILVAWFGGTEEKCEDTAIWLSMKKNGEWSYPKVVADEVGIAHWNPVLFEAPDGRCLLYYKVGTNVDCWHTRWCVSCDQGHSWTEPRELISGDIGGRGPVKNKPIVSQDGTWLAPASIEQKDQWDSFVDISTDSGKAWVKSFYVPINHKIFPREGIIQPTLWESLPGHIHMLIRSSSGYICRSDSIDGGRNWSEVYETSLPNNNSGIDLVKIRGSILALVYNPVQQKGEEWGTRSPLVVSFSSDNGISWPITCCLEKIEGEFSYPAIVATENDISITYTWNRERIVYVSMPIGQVLEKMKKEVY